jgi:ribosomal protein S18 acetylase RimI-like enzyme
LIQRVHCLEEIKSLLSRYFEFFPDIFQKVSSLEEYATKLADHAMVEVAKNDQGESVGLIAYYANDLVHRCTYVALIAVLPEYRSMNIGRELLESCVRSSRQEGMKFIGLDCFKDNQRAIAFYSNFGFSVKSSDSEAMFHFEYQIPPPFQNIREP